MNWTAGYASDVEYTAGFYREQSPVYLNFACVLNGYEPVPLNRPFTYCELGFGRGLTVSLQAAAHPNGQFYATDFNPGHVAGARNFADAAQLSNLHLLENSFEELAKGEVDLPQFDFITLHGIYTWVTRENRAHIAEFIRRYLKPGGIVYMSYNAMPGWAAALPMQRLLVEHGDLHPNRSDLQVNAGAQFIEKLAELNAGYFNVNPSLKSRVEVLKNGSRNYLVHEYMHRHWEPMYHVDVARDMANAKLDFIGSADLPFAYHGLYLDAPRQELLNSVSNPSMRETVLDYLFNTQFRRDVFVRGPRRMSPMRQAEWLGQVGVALLVPRKDVSLQMKLGIGEVNGKEESYGPVLDALAEKPMTLEELGRLPKLQGQTYGNLTQIATMLFASNQVGLYFNHAKTPSGEAAKRLNRVLAQQVRYSDEWQALASPLLGNGVSANYMERMVYLIISAQPKFANDLTSLVNEAWRMMSAQGRRMMREGKPLESAEENQRELAAQIDAVLMKRLPIWRSLLMI
ncbi:methyltransferase regulatory domain-containing protein [Massilia sp. W12]|uniref:methyltransferase regulatory domain-containing protein n=1 Tax=Massilia sp. W12 TaxID=3126507 RepID=UPI0030D4063F